MRETLGQRVAREWYPKIAGLNNSGVDDLREKLAALVDRLGATFRHDAQVVADLLELGDARIAAADGPCGGQNAATALTAKESATLYKACVQIAAHLPVDRLADDDPDRALVELAERRRKEGGETIPDDEVAAHLGPPSPGAVRAAAEACAARAFNWRSDLADIFEREITSHLAAGSKWTKERPTRSGYYWVRCTPPVHESVSGAENPPVISSTEERQPCDCCPEIAYVWVDKKDGRLMAQFTSGTEKDRLYTKDSWFTNDPEWSGPIPLPEPEGK